MKARSLIGIFALLALAACEQEGPAEQRAAEIGRQIDEAREAGGDAIDEAVEEAADRLEAAGDAVEPAAD